MRILIDPLTMQQPKNANTANVDSVYIIRIPVKVDVENFESGSFSIVQVGKASSGVEGLRKRLYEHSRAWRYASGENSKFLNVTQKRTPLGWYQPSHLTGEKNELTDLIGVIALRDAPPGDLFFSVLCRMD